MRQECPLSQLSINTLLVALPSGINAKKQEIKKIRTRKKTIKLLLFVDDTTVKTEVKMY